MDSSSITDSSRATHVDVDIDYESAKFKVSPGSKSLAEALEFEAEISTAFISDPWYRRFTGVLAPKYPRLTRFILYLRGPRPKVDLPGWLNTTLHFVPPNN